MIHFFERIEQEKSLFIYFLQTQAVHLLVMDASMPIKLVKGM